jgi:hypothetical protein
VAIRRSSMHGPSCEALLAAVLRLAPADHVERLREELAALAQLYLDRAYAIETMDEIVAEAAAMDLARPALPN